MPSLFPNGTHAWRAPVFMLLDYGPTFQPIWYEPQLESMQRSWAYLYLLVAVSFPPFLSVSSS